MLRSLAPILLLCTALAAQAPDFQRYGAGCLAPPMVIEPWIEASALPALGTTISVDYVGLEGRVGTADLVPILLTGTTAVRIPVPTDLFVQQRPGCTVLVESFSAIAAVPDPNRPGHYVTRVTLRVPNQSALIGVEWYHQWLVACMDCSVSPRCRLLGVGASDGGRLRIGR